MFADDFSHFNSHPNKEVAEAAIQESLTSVAEWSRRRKLTLSASKCDFAFFTINSKDAHWQHSLQLDGVLLTTTSLSKFLAVIIGRALFFRAACRRSSFQSLQQMSGTRLTYLQMVGLEERLLMVYWALHLSVISYAAKRLF